MALLNSMTRFCCVSPRCASTPISQDSPSPAVPSPSDPRQTRVILPKKKPLKWSTGVAPGEYGGPPTTTKLRQYWGGEKDPLDSDDYMWNKEFMGPMKRLIEQPDSSVQSASPSKEDSGFLSLNRAMSLNSMDIDLSKELVSTSPKPVLELQVEAARRGRLSTESTEDVKPKWRFVPTRREQEKWDKANKAATGGSGVILHESKRDRGDPKILAAQSREQYFKLKWKLQFLTLGIGGIGVFSAYVSYSPEIAASYNLGQANSHNDWDTRFPHMGSAGIFLIPMHNSSLLSSLFSFGAGLLGSLVYIRLLGNSVDSMASGAKGMAKAAVAQPRLLVPVALVMIYNRWNEILVPDFGFTHLNLIPMLVGFFTYKVATFVQAIEDALTALETKQEA